MNTQPQPTAPNTTPNLFDLFPADRSKLDVPSLPSSRKALSFMDMLTPTTPRPTRDLLPNYKQPVRFVLREGYELDYSVPCKDSLRCPDCGGPLVSNTYRHMVDRTLGDFTIRHCADSLTDGATCFFWTVR